VAAQAEDDRMNEKKTLETIILVCTYFIYFSKFDQAKDKN
jgi:hypothetical protein